MQLTTACEVAMHELLIAAQVSTFFSHEQLKLVSSLPSSDMHHVWELFLLRSAPARIPDIKARKDCWGHHTLDFVRTLHSSFLVLMK